MKVDLEANCMTENKFQASIIKGCYDCTNISKLVKSTTVAGELPPCV
jgi:hypothetical protein